MPVPTALHDAFDGSRKILISRVKVALGGDDLVEATTAAVGQRSHNKEIAVSSQGNGGSRQRGAWQRQGAAIRGRGWGPAVRRRRGGRTARRSAGGSP